MKKTILFFTLLAVVAFSSCDKEGKDFKKDFDKDYEKNYDKDKKDCFELVYPVTYTMPDGTTITGDEATVWTAIKGWYEDHPGSAEKPSLNYPIDVVFEDGDTKSINDEEEIILLKKACGDKDYDKDKWELCTWDEATEASGSTFEKHIVKELVTSNDCGCITEGVEKFLENAQTRFLIYYGEKDCVGYGIKVTCEDGDCKNAVKCWFEQACQS